MDSGIGFTVIFKHWEQYAVQGNFACSNCNDSRLQAVVSGDFLFTAQNMFKCNGDMGI